jgi:hypothetical protein
MLMQAVVMAYAIQQKISRMRTAYTDTVVNNQPNKNRQIFQSNNEGGIAEVSHLAGLLDLDLEERRGGGEYLQKSIEVSDHCK